MEKYGNIKQNKAEGDVTMYFMDATHPRRNPVIGCGWIKRGIEDPISSNTGRRRLNINGAINVQTMSAEIRFDETIDAVSTIVCFSSLSKRTPRPPVSSCSVTTPATTNPRPLPPISRPREFNLNRCRLIVRISI